MCEFMPVASYDPSCFISTSNGNVICRSALLCKPQNIDMPHGKCIVLSGVIIRGDFAVVKIDKYCLISKDTVLRPAYGIMTSGFRYIPLSIGAYTTIGENCVVESAVIGMGCNIGNKCVLSMRCILKDHVCVEDGTVIPPDTVIPPFAIVSGAPSRIVGFVSESHSTLCRSNSMMKYKSFQPLDQS